MIRNPRPLRASTGLGKPTPLSRTLRTILVRGFLEADVNPAGLAVFHGIADGLLRDAKEVGLGSQVTDPRGRFASKLALDTEQTFRASGQLFEGPGQALASQIHRPQPTRQFTRVRHGLAGQPGDFPGARRFGPGTGRQLPLQGSRQKLYARQLLAHVVMQILADSLLNPFANRKDLLLQFHPPGHIADEPARMNHSPLIPEAIRVD